MSDASKPLRDWLEATASPRPRAHRARPSPAAPCAPPPPGARIHVLGYHRVVDASTDDGPVNPSLCITTDAFRRQMEQLRERFVVLPLAVRRARRRRRARPRRTTPPPSPSTTAIATCSLRAASDPARARHPGDRVRADRLRRRRRPRLLLPHDRLYAAAWAAQRRGRGLADLGDTETALAVRRAPIACSPTRGPGRRRRGSDRAAPAGDARAHHRVLETRLRRRRRSTTAPAVLSPDRGARARRRAAGRSARTPSATSCSRTSRPTSSAASSPRPRPTLERVDAAAPAATSPTATASTRRRSSPSCAAPATRAPSPPATAPTRRAAAIPSASRARSCGRRTRAAPTARFSPSLSAAHLHDTFGALGLTAPVDGAVDQPEANRDPRTDSIPSPRRWSLRTERLPHHAPAPATIAFGAPARLPLHRLREPRQLVRRARGHRLRQDRRRLLARRARRQLAALQPPPHHRRHARAGAARRCSRSSASRRCGRYWPKYTLRHLRRRPQVPRHLLHRRQRRRLRGAPAPTLIRVLALASCIPAFGAIWSHAHGEHLVEGDRAGWIGIFGNPNDLAYHLVVGVRHAARRRATPPHARCARSRGGRCCAPIFYAHPAHAVARRHARRGASSRCSGRCARSSARRSSSASPLIAALSSFISPNNPWSRRTAGEPTAYGEDISAQGRIDAWRTGLNIAKERPFTGVGAGAFMIAWPEFAPGDAGDRCARSTTRSSSCSSELGIPALLLFVAALAAGALRHASRAELAAYAAAVRARRPVRPGRLRRLQPLGRHRLHLADLPAARHRVRRAPHLVRAGFQPIAAPRTPSCRRCRSRCRRWSDASHVRDLRLRRRRRRSRRSRARRRHARARWIARSSIAAPTTTAPYFDGRCAMGMRRLSIIDLGGGSQPIANEDRRYWIVFNGEIYNYRDAARAARSRAATASPPPATPR